MQKYGCKWAYLSCYQSQAYYCVYYIRQVNEVKLADIMFSLLSVCLSVCVSVCAHMAAVFHTQYINANRVSALGTFR